MICKKKMLQIARKAENTVHKKSSDIDNLIKLHANLGLFEFEVFADTKMAKKIKTKLESKGYYARITEFVALPEECRIHVSWISNF